MSEPLQAYQSRITGLFEQILSTQQPQIRQAAQRLSRAIQEDRKIHLLGTGAHSQLAVEEVLWRAGGLAAWNPILDPGTSLVHGAKRSVSFERLPGYGVGVLNANQVGETPGETMVLINAYGIDPMSLDVALECRRRGVYTIGVTSLAYGRATPADSPIRHPSGKNLFEEVDLLIDSQVPLGDAVGRVPGFAQEVGSSSSLCSCFVMNLLVIATVEELQRSGAEPPVFMSANLPQGDAANARWERKYGPQARYLL